jgi:hypothetical protein
MPEIEMTEFVRPNGMQQTIRGEVRDAAFAKYKELTALGLRLTAENLNNGMVNFCIEQPTYGDFDMIVVPNTPETVSEVETMLERFNADEYAAWVERRKDLD